MTEGYLLLGIMLVLLIATGIAAILYNMRLSKQVIRQFETLGERFGLEITVPQASLGGLYQRNPTLYGKHADREMSIYPRGYGMDNTRQTDVALRIETRAPKEFALTFAKRNAIAKLGQMRRLEVCETGDAAFDKAFSLRSNNPGAASALFGAEMRERICGVWKADSGFLSLHDRILAYEEMGLPRSEAQSNHLEEVAKLCLELADALDAF